MRKIVYLIEQPLDERNYDRFGIQVWIDRDWIVEIWDLTPLAFPSVWKHLLESQTRFKDFAGYFPITSKSLLKSMFSRLGRLEYFIDFTSENFHSIRIKTALILKGSKRVIYASGGIPVPEPSRPPGILAKLRRISAKGPISALNMMGTLLTKKLIAPLIKPSLTIVSGENSILAAGQSGEILRVHSFDYDIFLRLAKCTEMPVRDYVVFIDQDVCFHSDFIFQGVPFIVTPEKYFPAICKGLSAIAEKLSVRVRIAAHPRASYKQRGINHFEGFPVEYGKTAELIKGCRVVVCHDSTAIHFAVLFEKPMIFVTTDELIPTYEGRSIAQVASEFGKSAVNLDRDLRAVDWRKETYVDVAKYREYRNRYIKIDGTPERQMWEVVVDHIEGAKKPTATLVQERCASAGCGK
jgi:hypothetical protein